MKVAKLLAVVGTKGSGKTTTVECIISGLTRRGFRVGSIKHVHHPGFTIDTEGTDTWRQANAGSRVVAAVSSKEIALMLKDDPEEMLPSVLEFMSNRELDIIVIEGLHSSIGRRSDVFKIVTGHDVEDLKQRLHGTVPPILAISGRVAEEPSHLADIGVPVINSETHCSELIERIEQEVLRR